MAAIIVKVISNTLFYYVDCLANCDVCTTSSNCQTCLTNYVLLISNGVYYCCSTSTPNL